MKYYLSLTLVLLTISACTSKANTPYDVMERLEQEGQPYFQQLVSSGQYDALLDAIEAGDERAIADASVLAKWTDASTSTSLKYALSRAVKRNPDAVMKLIPGSFSIKEICTIPYIEESIEVELSHAQDSLTALQKSTRRSQSHVQCIHIYQTIESNISRLSAD